MRVSPPGGCPQKLRARQRGRQNVQQADDNASARERLSSFVLLPRAMRLPAKTRGVCQRSARVYQ
jgi:hypothetical protein